MNLMAKPFIRMVFACLLFVGACGAVAAISFTPNTACATPSAPPTPCDPQYMDALEARAWLEAQREIAQNQNLINKPDSVLEYSCFDRFLYEIADHANQMFSETTRWESIDDLDAASQDRALTALVYEGLVNYLTTNFPHNFLGHRADSDYDMPTTWANPTAPYTYQCDRLREVWREAKCLNFFDEANGAGVRRNHDGFYDFAWYQTNDPRQLPPEDAGTGFAACIPPAEEPYTFATMQRISFNDRQAMYVLSPENPNNVGTLYNRDDLVTFLNFILPRGVEPATECQDPIQTGVQVNRRMGGGDYPDGVCPNPGCYLGTGGTSCE